MGDADPAARWLSTGDLVSLLAPTIGQEKSREAVLSAARALALEGDVFAWEQAMSILDSLSTGAGILAVAARFVRERFTRQPAGGGGLEAGGDEAPPRSAREAPGAPDDPARMTTRKLKAQLAPALGQEKSEQLVADAMKQLGLRGGELTPEQALSILDLLAAVPGLVGVTARFARARFPRLLGGPRPP